jgi:hypothetical protein
MSQVYSLGETGSMKVEGKGSILGDIILILTATVLGLTNWTGSLPILILSLTIGVIALASYLCKFEVLIVTPNQIRYQHKTLLGLRKVNTSRDTLLAVRLAISRDHEVRSYAVDLVLSHAALPVAIRVFESLEDEAARSVANQVAKHLSAALLTEI